MTLLRVQSFAVSARRLRRRPAPGPREPARRPRPRADGVVLPHARVAADARPTGDGETGVDNEMAEQGFEGIGAWILGRNMFGPVRGPWPDESWKGWWGDEPPYHVPVFVLTHHARAAARDEGRHRRSTSSPTASTPRSSRRRRAAGGRDVRLGGGVATIRQYLQAGLIDELHLAVRPVLLGAGRERCWQGLDLRALGYECAEARRRRARDARLPAQARVTSNVRLQVAIVSSLSRRRRRAFRRCCTARAWRKVSPCPST